MNFGLAGAVVVLALTVLAANVASAEVLAGSSPVRIWKSVEAMEQGQNLLGASARPDANALAPLLACEVAAGTRATIERAPASYAWQAEVTEGSQRGCRGIVGPRDFKTEAELTRRSPEADAPASAPFSPPSSGATTAAPGSAAPSDERTRLWYQLSVLVDNGAPRTSWQPVAAWETVAQCDNARRRLLEADEREVNAIVDKLDALSGAARGQITMTHVPREYGLDLELRRVSREGERTVHVEVRTYCFPADKNPQR